MTEGERERLHERIREILEEPGLWATGRLRAGAWRLVATQLNEEGFSTPRGKRWGGHGLQTYYVRNVKSVRDRPRKREKKRSEYVGARLPADLVRKVKRLEGSLTSHMEKALRVYLILLEKKAEKASLKG